MRELWKAATLAAVQAVRKLHGPGERLICSFPYRPIEQRMVEPRERHTAFPFQIKDHDLVLAFFQPDARDVECLLRANVPVAAEGVAIDPDRAFAQCADIKK